MKKLFPISIICLLALSAYPTSAILRRLLHVNIHSANIYYVNPTTGNDANNGLSAPWATLAPLATNVFPINSTVDGSSAVYYQRIVVPTNNITIRNLTVDGTLSLDGNYSFASDGTYGNTNAWSIVVNTTEVYQKNCDRTIVWMSQNGIALEPMVCANIAAVTNNLARGQFSFISGSPGHVYVRCSDGSDISTKQIRVTRRDLDTSKGWVYVDKTNVNLINLNVRNVQRSGLDGGFYLTNANTVNLISCGVTNATVGIRFTPGVNITITNCSVVSNVTHGIVGHQENTNIYILNTYVAYNGRVKQYAGTTYGYVTDGDGIGFGLYGSNMCNIVIGSCIINSNGVPDWGNPDYGHGITFETGSPMAINLAVITNNTIIGNHLNGLAINDQVTNKIVTGNLIVNSGNSTGLYWHAVNIKTTAGGSILVANNLIANNTSCTNNAGALVINNADSTGSIVVTNNSLYNNGGLGAYRADIVFVLTASGKTNIVEDYNTINRVPVVWALTNCFLKHTGTTFGKDQSAAWQAVNSQGAHDTWTTNSALVNPTSLTFP